MMNEDNEMKFLLLFSHYRCNSLLPTQDHETGLDHQFVPSENNGDAMVTVSFLVDGNIEQQD